LTARSGREHHAPSSPLARRLPLPLAATVRSLPLTLIAVLSVALVTPAAARTARDLSQRIVIDGFTADFADSDEVFGFNEQKTLPEEPVGDSPWGADNDISQIRLTWDKNYLYVAGEAVTWGNNLVILFDVFSDQGLTTMKNLNGWSRNFSFDGDSLNPDLFGATWDGNALPQVWLHRGGQLGGLQVDQQPAGTAYTAAATFSQNQRGRAMELRIPWNTLFLGPEGFGVRDTIVTRGGAPDTLHRLPPGARIKLVAVLTAGGDNTGGPDSAPDNSTGHVQDANASECIDNYALIDLDRNDDTGLGAGGPDGIPDWDVNVKQRVSFRFRPPLQANRVVLTDVRWTRPAFAPDRGERADFCVRYTQPRDPGSGDKCRSGEGIEAAIYDLGGNLRRSLSVRVLGGVQLSDRRSLANRSLASFLPNASWDGRDDVGRIVPPGVYILRVALDDASSCGVGRFNKAIVVAR
jgi:hypothetical protein